MCKYDTSVLRIRIDFTKAGRREFNRVNAKLGKAYIRFFMMERDLAEYIERHIDGGNPLIAEFDVRYEGDIVLTIYCSGGIYYIKGVSNIGTVIGFTAIMLWQRFKQGCDYRFRQVLSGWCHRTIPLAASC